MKKNASLAAGALLTAFTIGYGVRVLADGAPAEQSLFYSGTLESGGQAVSGSHTVSLGLYSAERGGTALCDVERDAEVAAGRFRIDVSECADALRENADAYVAVAFRGSDGVDHAIEGRAKVGAVPYALEADRAKVAGAAEGALAAQLEALTERIAALEGGSSSTTAFRARATSSPTLAAGAVQVVFDEELFDMADDYDPTTGVFKAKADGKYEFICSIAWAIGTRDKPGQYEAAVFQNGIERSYSGHSGDGYATTRQVHVVMELEINDEVTCRAYQERDDVTLNVAGYDTTFVGRRFAP